MRQSFKLIMICIIVSLLGGCHTAVTEPKKALPALPEQANWTNSSPIDASSHHEMIQVAPSKHTRQSPQAEGDKKLKFTLHAEKKQQQLQEANRSQLKKRQKLQQSNRHMNHQSGQQTKQNRHTHKEHRKQLHAQTMTKERKLSLPELRIRYPDIFKMRGSASEKKVALTFDDVPDNTVTPVVLDILKEMNVKATFFLVGYRAKAHPELVKRIVAEGHTLGNHTYSHPLLTKAEMPKFINQLKDTEDIIEALAGYKPRFFRPPFGEITEEQLKWAGDHGYIVVNWDVDSNDWRGISTKAVEDNVMSTVSSGSIVLQHAGGNGKREYLQNTIHALPSIIKQLRAQDYHFVTLPELLHDQQQKREQ